MKDSACLILRLGLGIMFCAHGLQKAFGTFDGIGIQGFADFVSTLGFKPAVFWAYLAAYTELIGGLFLIVGFLTRIAAFSLSILIITAGIKVHLENGFFLQNGGIEYVFVIVCACIALMLLGAGKFALNKKL